MITVWILTVYLSGGGFDMVPLSSLEECESNAKLHITATHTECYQIEMFAPSSINAPEMAPLPKDKPR